ncbi:putative mediator of RNA polymerase II transcription subunit 15a-like isoform X2 [Capsicum annuum]|nr:putative mediator of RNA polymerase II transcription subunit 15a-like isoform X2 [Capsicum annuum]
MDLNDRRSRVRARARARALYRARSQARARFQAKWVDVTGIHTGMLSETETLARLLPESNLGVQEVMKTAARDDNRSYFLQNYFWPEENDEEQAVEGDDGDLSKEDVEEEVVVKKEQNYVVGHEENVRVGENEISCGLIDGAKLDEHLVHVEERLEKMETHSEKMVTLENKSQNPMTNYVLPSAASSCQNMHGTEMAMEATSYKINSGPEDDKEQAAEEEAEEDAGDMSKEDFVEEVMVKKEQNYVVGHEENVTVGENEDDITDLLAVNDTNSISAIALVDYLVPVAAGGRWQISCGLSVGAKLDERLVQVEERLEKMETLLVDINEKLNCLVKMQDAKGSMDLRRPAKYMSSLWIGNGRSKRKHRAAELIRQSCKHRRLGKGDKAVVHPVALHDDCVENDQRKLDDEEPTI